MLTEKQHEAERAELLRAVRAQSTRAELAEAALESATSECTLWNPIAAGVRAASHKVGGAVAGATEHVAHASRHVAREAGEAVVGVAKEAPGFVALAAGKSMEIWPAARRLVEKLREANDSDPGFKIHPVG